MFDRIKDGFFNVFKSRVAILIVLISVLFLVLIGRLFKLQIVNGQSYLDNYKLKIQKTKEVQGTRGNIYDRNGELLAYNELAYSVTIEDNGEYETRADKNKVLNKTIRKVIDLVEDNGDTIVSDFGIILNTKGKYEYAATESTTRLRFLADVFGYTTIDKLSKKERSYTAEELMDYLCTDETYGYGIDQKKYDAKSVLKLVTIRYSIGLNSFQKYIATVIASQVSEETVAAVMENKDSLQGVSVEEESIRKYNDSKYFSTLIGYTGQISQEEYDELSQKNSNYSLTDIIGKAGLEQSMDGTLQGAKGEEKIYVDSVGQVIDTVEAKTAGSGNNLYLSIDKNLQIATYNIIEQKLAGILLKKISNTMNYDPSKESDTKNIIIPIDDVYNAFIGNEIIDSSHFSDEKAGENEKKVYSIFEKRKAAEIENIATELQDGSKTYNESSTAMKAFLNYIESELLTTDTGVLMSDSIDTESEIHTKWATKGSISLKDYLTYAIAQNWVDTSKLSDYVKAEEKYTNSDEVYQGIISYIKEYLKDDSKFDKLVYKYMIKDGSITGKQLCMIAYEQGVFKTTDSDYKSLSGGGSAYSFVRKKIRTLELTPAMLGLEPCTASAVITDSKTGSVLACVSYPGYDSNRLANSMDSSYYNKLVNDKSRPFYITATQEKTAPGSTYKMLSSVAGLTEGVIDTDSYINCAGIYRKVTPNPKCWAYPNAHGSLNVVSAIEHSCNAFFFEVGYRLSLKDTGIDKINSGDSEGKSTQKYYSSDLGLSKLSKYAAMFGLNETSGVEIPESEPQVSDSDSVRSAIGQGTNNYTTTQLARYVTTVANKGTLFKLSLLDKATDSNGKTVKDYTPETTSTLSEIDSSTWDAVHKGMKQMVSSSSTFTKLRSEGLNIAGKTGTAQQSKSHSDHALFVGYAPADDPEIAFAIRIANGYQSGYTSEIGSDIMEYYFNLTDKKNIVTGKATDVGTVTSHD